MSSDLENGPETPLFAWENSRYRAWPTVFEEFLAEHFQNVSKAKSSGVQQYSAPRPADKDQINYIISMYCSLKWFLLDYQSFVRSTVHGNPPPLSNLDPSFLRQQFHQETKDWPPLTENEGIRLQRGFLRYELCSRLNAIPAWQTSITQWGDNPYLMAIEDDAVLGFDNSLSPFVQRWEEEEIMCVWAYVYRQYNILAQDILDDYRSEIHRLSRKARRTPDSELTLAPEINKWFEGSLLFERWTYNMSCLGLPMLQQVLRSEFDDQRRFLNNSSFETMPQLGGSLFLHDTAMNDLGEEWNPQPTFRPFRNLPTTNGANSIFLPIAKKLGSWRHMRRDHRHSAHVSDMEEGLQAIGWVFWEDDRRLQRLGWGDRPGSSIRGTENFLGDVFRQTERMSLEVDDKYREQSLYIDKKDVRGELSATYAVDSPKPGAEYFFLDRLRAISDWSSKEVSPAFQEICSGMPASE